MAVKPDPPTCPRIAQSLLKALRHFQLLLLTAVSLFNMIKKRTRPTTAARSKLPTDDDTPKGDSTEPTEPLVEEGEELRFVFAASLIRPLHEHGLIALSIADLLELQRIRKSKQGIDSLKLNKGVAKRRRRTEEEEEQEKGGLKPGTKQHETYVKRCSHRRLSH